MCTSYYDFFTKFKKFSVNNISLNIFFIFRDVFCWSPNTEYPLGCRLLRAENSEVSAGISLTFSQGMTDPPTFWGHLYSLPVLSAEAFTLCKTRLSSSDVRPGQLPSAGFNPLGALVCRSLPAAQCSWSPIFSIPFVILEHHPVAWPLIRSPAPPHTLTCFTLTLGHLFLNSFSLTHLNFSLSSSAQPINVDIPKGLVTGLWRPRRSPAQFSQRPCSSRIWQAWWGSGATLFLPNTDFFNGQSVLALKLLSLTKAFSPNSPAI